MSSRSRRIYAILLPLLAVLAAGNLFYGAVPVPPSAVWKVLTGGEAGNPAWAVILTGSRLPQMITALLAGAALAVSGLLLQTLFRNPLAGPSILGISDGANLGVALVMLAFGGTVGSLGGYLATVAGAMLGACIILAVIVFFSRKVSSSVMLLIVGIMVGYLVSSCISILNYYASADKVRQFVMWGMGDFSAVSPARLPLFAAVSLAGLVFSFMLVKPLNALLLGEKYAVCRQSGRQHHGGQDERAYMHRPDDGRGDGILRPGILHRPGGAAYRPSADRYLRPPRTGAGDHALGSLHCPCLQHAHSHSRDRDTASAQRRDTPVRCACHHICHSQP